MVNAILCPIDGSEHADKAVQLASDLAHRYGARLVFLHVLPSHLSMDELSGFESHAHLHDIVRAELDNLRAQMVDAVGPYAAIYVPPVSREVISRIGEVILADAKLVAEQHGVETVEYELDSGDAAVRIVEWAQKIRADMIVLGSRGLGAVAGLFMGSVSQKVSHHAECTCVSVK